MAGIGSDFHTLLEQAQRNQKISESLLSQRKDPVKQTVAKTSGRCRRKDLQCRTKQPPAPVSKTAPAKTSKPTAPTPARKVASKPATSHSFSDLMRLAKTNIAPKESQPPKAPEKSVANAPVRTGRWPVQPKQQPVVAPASVPKKRTDNTPAPKPVTRVPVQKPKPLPRRPVAKKSSKLPTCEEEDEDDDMDDFIVDDDDCEDRTKISATIRSLFKYNRNRRIDYDDDDDCMESSYNDIIKEEKRSARIGMLEDLEDMMREEKERQKRKKKT